jgi:hypothetical protein
MVIGWTVGNLIDEGIKKWQILHFDRSYQNWLVKTINCKSLPCIARVCVDDEIMGSALYSGGELVGATHGRGRSLR